MPHRRIPPSLLSYDAYLFPVVSFQLAIGLAIKHNTREEEGTTGESPVEDLLVKYSIYELLHLGRKHLSAETVKKNKDFALWFLFHETKICFCISFYFSLKNGKMKIQIRFEKKFALDGGQVLQQKP